MGIMVRHKQLRSHMAPRPTHHHLSTQQFQRQHLETARIQQWQVVTPATPIHHHNRNTGHLHKRQLLSPTVPLLIPLSQPDGRQPEYLRVSRTIPLEILPVTTIRSMPGNMQRNMQIISTRRNTQEDTIGTLLEGTLRNTQTGMTASTPITTRVGLRLHDV